MSDLAINYQLLKKLQENPSMSQRDMAECLGVSLGKTNFCLNALIEKGWIKVNNFRKSNNKLAYAYFLTPTGIEQKTRLTVEFLHIKSQQYEQLRSEIEILQQEANLR